MAEHFLCKTRFAPGDLVELNGVPVLERHAEFRAMLAERAGPEVAALFAEPLISRGNDEAAPTIAWYVDRPGNGELLEALTPSRRAEAEAWLADHLRPLRSLSEAPDTAELVRAALWLRGEDDIRMAGERPVIVNWGILPAAIADDPAARTAHRATTIGRFLTLSSTAPKPGATIPGETRPLTGQPDIAAQAQAATPTAVATTAATAAATAAAAAALRRLEPVAWVPLAVLLSVAVLVLAWLLLPGTRLFPPSGAASSAEVAALGAEVNHDLRARRDELAAALTGAVCRADGTLILPDGRTPEGLIPPSDAGPDGSLPSEADGPRTAAGTARPTLAPPSSRVLVPDPGAGGGSFAPGVSSLLEVVEQSTVFIMVQGTDGTSSGTGFVVAPGVVLTNDHVVRGARSDGVRVLHGSLTAPLRAEILRSSGPLEQSGGDYALLQVEGLTLPPLAFYLPGDSLRLTGVVAAGFPGDVLNTDAGFSAALQAGRMPPAPRMVVTEGVVNAEQTITSGALVLVHSAPLSSGNSGGPLVDLCGRVVGVNTFVRRGPLRTLNFALSTQDAAQFVGGNGIEVHRSDAACEPTVLRPSPMSAEPTEPSAAPAPGGDGAAPGAAAPAGP